VDIQTLTKEAILKNMTPEQQQAVLNSVMASVNQSKQVRTQKVAENVDLVMKALKQIEAKMLDRVSTAASKVEKVAASITNGKDGRDGKDGKDGKDGVQGPKGADGRAGRDGKDGKDGVNGLDGVSVVNAFLDFDNSLVIELSNGKQINVGGAISGETADKVRVVANGGGTSQGVLDAIAALQAEIDAISPTLVITDTFVVASQAAMLALSTAEKGDVAVRTDINKTFILKANPYSTLANWQELLTPTDAVQSVNGQTGTVVLTTTDVAEGTNQYFTNARARGALTAGTGISYNSTTGVITNSSPDQTVSITGSGTTSVTGTYPNFTVSSADQYVGTVTSVAALTLGTTGTDVSSTVATGTTTPVITLNIPTASATNRGALSSTDWSTFNGKQAALVSGTNIKTVNSNSLLGSGNISVGTVTSVGGTGTVNGLTLSGTVTGSGNLTLGGTLDLSSPPAIGGTAPSTGAFTTLKVGSSSILGNANADVTLGLAVRNSGASMGYLQTYNGNAGADLKTWRFGGDGSGNLVFETVNDAYSSSTNRMTLDKTGNLTAASFKTTNFTIVESGSSLLIKYGSTTIASISSTGVITSATNIIANGTP
jgi:hypothetical protein